MRDLRDEMRRALLDIEKKLDEKPNYQRWLKILKAWKLVKKN